LSKLSASPSNLRLAANDLIFEITPLVWAKRIAAGQQQARRIDLRPEHGKLGPGCVVDANDHLSHANGVPGAHKNLRDRSRSGTPHRPNTRLLQDSRPVNGHIDLQDASDYEGQGNKHGKNAKRDRNGSPNEQAAGKRPVLEGWQPQFAQRFDPLRMVLRKCHSGAPHNA
jgi:hypothetical protein